MSEALEAPFGGGLPTGAVVLRGVLVSEALTRQRERAMRIQEVARECIIEARTLENEGKAPEDVGGNQIEEIDDRGQALELRLSCR